MGNCNKYDCNKPSSSFCSLTNDNTCCLDCLKDNNYFTKCYNDNCCCEEIHDGMNNVQKCMYHNEYTIKEEKQIEEIVEVVKRKTGKEFRESGLLWFINTTLHMFGWAICWDTETDEIYPARVKYRGFDEENNTQGYIKVSKYLQENINELVKESQE